MVIATYYLLNGISIILLTESHSVLAHFATGFCSLLDSIPVCPGGLIQSCLLSASSFDRLAKNRKKSG